MGSDLALILLPVLSLVLVALGVPIAFALGSVAGIVALMIFPAPKLALLATAGYGNLQDLNLAAIPMFVFMGWVLEKSHIADDMFGGLELLLRRVPGGLAVGAILISAVLGAVMGELVAALVTVSTLALPAMLRRGYDARLAVGTIMAGALLGLIIPPSIEIIVYASSTGVSLGRLYLAAFLPGFLLAAIYIVFIVIRCRLNPSLAPGAAQTEQPEDRVRLILNMFVPFGIIAILIVGIYSGAFSPMEASTVGVALSLVVALVRRRLTFPVFRDALTMTVRVTAMIVWLFIGIGIFMSVFNSLGGLATARELAASAPGGAWSSLLFSQAVLLVGGAFIDDFALIMLFGPVFSTAMTDLGFDPLWYGILFLLNMQVAFLTPPYGFALFCMRASLPPDSRITMVDIYMAAIPFILLQLVCIALVMLFPAIATFLPNAL
ncbi:TRAP transporter large permease [Tropicibacter alexandrii]|uniref:TRAP transporter large permease n=1 Tax=Tropicibacter alexandrii TaxID=2267683 RepID=UPI000EF51026|nr:TRAP transporter large permease subunit [Tropicibacter alexandrii]